MSPKLKTRFLALFALAAFAFGCNGSSSSGGATSAAPTTTDKRTDLTVGIVFDSGGRGDKSFNDSAYAGVEKALKESGIKVLTVDSKSESAFEENLTGLSDKGANLIFAVGVTQATALGNVAPKYPDTKYAIIDAEVAGENVRSLVFSEEQGSFLAGYVAGLTTKTGKVGFVGGKNIPLIKKFEAGYTAGARMANPKVQVLPAKYTESWDDTSTGKASATELFGEGADIVYHAAGRAGLGVIAAAKDAGKYAIGVDSDQDDQAPGTVLTSMVKHVDEAVYTTIKDTIDGKFTAGTKRYDLSANGVGLTDFQYTKDIVGADNLKKVDAIAAKIKDGSLKVPDKVEDVDAFLTQVAK